MKVRAELSLGRAPTDAPGLYLVADMTHLEQLESGSARYGVRVSTEIAGSAACSAGGTRQAHTSYGEVARWCANAQRDIEVRAHAPLQCNDSSPAGRCGTRCSRAPNRQQQEQHANAKRAATHGEETHDSSDLRAHGP
jgi:hypothetical protein